MDLSETVPEIFASIKKDQLSNLDIKELTAALGSLSKEACNMTTAVNELHELSIYAQRKNLTAFFDVTANTVQKVKNISDQIKRVVESYQQIVSDAELRLKEEEKRVKLKREKLAIVRTMCDRLVHVEKICEVFLETRKSTCVVHGDVEGGEA